MKEILGTFFVFLGIGLFFGYFIARPLAEIPKRIDDLTYAVKELAKVL